MDPFPDFFQKQPIRKRYMNPYLAELSEKITRWFHLPRGDDTSPAHSVYAVAAKFMNDSRQRSVRLADSHQRFYNLLCEATCSLYRAEKHNKRVIFNKRVRNPPSSWTPQIETMWMDYLETMLFSDAYWTAFWRDIDDAIWEYDLKEWRSYMQFVLLNAVQRDVYLLEDVGLLAKTDEGDFVKAEEYDPPTDDE